MYLFITFRTDIHTYVYIAYQYCLLMLLSSSLFLFADFLVSFEFKKIRCQQIQKWAIQFGSSSGFWSSGSFHSLWPSSVPPSISFS